MSFSIATFNVSRSVRDFENIYQKAEGETDDKIKAKYQAAERACAERMLLAPDDVYLFQEFVNPDRPLRQVLGDRFEFLATDRDCAIAFNRERFRDIRHEKTTHAYTIATATETVSGKRFAFSSLHAMGFGLQNPDMVDTKKFQDWQQRLARDYGELSETYVGDNDCEQLGQDLDTLRSRGTLREAVEVGDDIRPVDECVVGADMNTPLECWPHRFRKLTSRKLEYREPDEITNIHTHPRSSNGYPQRKLDFLFVTARESGIFRAVCSFFYEPAAYYNYSAAQVVHPGGNGWDAEGGNSFSDHAMVRIQADYRAGGLRTRNVVATCCLLGLVVLGGLWRLRQGRLPVRPLA